MARAVSFVVAFERGVSGLAGQIAASSGLPLWRRQFAGRGDFACVLFAAGFAGCAGFSS